MRKVREYVTVQRAQTPATSKKKETTNMTKTHEFNLTGAARKPLIEAIESFAKVKGVYQGAPKFGYAFIGIGVLDKSGALHFDCDLQVIMDCVTWLEQCGFACDTTPAFEDLQLTESEELGLGKERRDPIGEDGMQASDVPDADSFIVDLPGDTLNPAQLENLEKLIASKAGLIKKAVGADDLSVIQTEDGKLRFAWFPYTEDASEVNAYSTLVLQLCKAAKEQKRVTAKEKQVDNEKFAFRVFLIRLGFVGDDYKTDRKILLRNLTGNAAFKNGAPPKPTADEDTGINSLEETLADAELIHAVNASFETEGGADNE